MFLALLFLIYKKFYQLLCIRDKFRILKFTNDKCVLHQLVDKLINKFLNGALYIPCDKRLI